MRPSGPKPRFPRMEPRMNPSLPNTSPRVSTRSIAATADTDQILTARTQLDALRARRTALDGPPGGPGTH